VEAKAKVLDVLYPKDRTTKTVERSFPKKSSKEGEKDPKILSAREKLMSLRPVWQD
jgi:hypothetical protein